jgi:peptidoglycan/LPS O-acetylase OafA/YrhL
MNMLAFIGLAIVWVIGVMIAGMVIMYMRASDLNNSQDPLAAFIQGFMFGPIGVLAAFGPIHKSRENRILMVLGGVAGTFTFLEVYESI